jgi:PKD repeat protein
MQVTNKLGLLTMQRFMRCLLGSMLIATLAACGVGGEREPVLAGPDVVIPPVTTTVANLPPIGSFTATPNGLTVTFNASDSRDPDGTILGYQWNFGDGTTVLNTTSATVTHVFANSGTFMVNLIVLDSRGTVSTVVSQNISIAPIPVINQVPTAQFAAATSATAVGVNASLSTDPDGTITSYAWNFGEPTSSTNIANGISATHVYVGTGTFTVTLVVTDNGGLKATSTQQITINGVPNVNPVAQYTANRDALLVTFNAFASTDSDGTITKYAWNFGEPTSTSNTATGVTTTHGYKFAGSYTVTLVVTDNKGATTSIAQLWTVTPPAAVLTGELNDTGITASQCYQAGTDTFVLCSSALAIGTVTTGNLQGAPVTTFAPQDGMTGRDIFKNTPLDGNLGFSFTKIGSNGQVLPSNATQWSCVKDNVTGLMWENKTNDGSLHDISKKFTHLDNPNANQLVSGQQPTLAQINTVTNSVGFKNTVNSEGLCGATDWRIPESDELLSIADHGISEVERLDIAWFFINPGNSFASTYITAAASPALSANSYVYVNSGVVNQSSYRDVVTNSMRLVRGAFSSEAVAPRFQVSGATVYDSNTGLTWRRCADGTDYDTVLNSCVGNPATFTHEAALVRAARVGQGWRVPNIKELSSLVDRSKLVPNTPSIFAIDAVAFPGFAGSSFWSSTPNLDQSWYVDFSSGFTARGPRTPFTFNPTKLLLVQDSLL